MNHCTIHHIFNLITATEFLANLQFHGVPAKQGSLPQLNHVADAAVAVNPMSSAMQQRGQRMNMQYIEKDTGLTDHDRIPPCQVPPSEQGKSLHV